jgi:hypothetical protein
MSEPIRQIIFPGECIDSNDPLRLGRIRAILKIENTLERERANENFGIKTYEEWGYNDPFVYLPLLPYFVSVKPKEQEYVHLIFMNSDKKGSKNKFYISGVFSSPSTSSNEPYNSAVTNLEDGSRNRKFPNIINEKNNGVFVGPEDVGLIGRGTADVVVKDETVLIRAGKNKPYNPNQIPEPNNKRAFIQTSNYQTKTLFGTPEKKYKFKYNDKKINTLIEYNITNPENQFNLFSGSINIYSLKDVPETNTSKFNVNTNVENSKSIQTTISFSNTGLIDLITLINTIIIQTTKGNLSDIENNFQVTIGGKRNFDIGLLYPIYYRPQSSLFEKYNDTSSSNYSVILSNLGVLFNSIKITPQSPNDGFGLIYDKSKSQTVPFDPEEIVTIPKTTISQPNTANIIGADTIYLLSYDSQKSGQEKINLDEKTLYGINESTLTDEIEPKTSSTVRGEELIDLLGLIIQFLISHAHPMHNTPPDSKSYSNVTSQQLLDELLNAYQKILNSNIRIN